MTRIYCTTNTLPTARSHTRSGLSVRVVPDFVNPVDKRLAMWTGQFTTRFPAGAGGFISSAQRLDPLLGPSSPPFIGYRAS